MVCVIERKTWARPRAGRIAKLFTSAISPQIASRAVGLGLYRVEPLGSPRYPTVGECKAIGGTKALPTVLMEVGLGAAFTEGSGDQRIGPPRCKCLTDGRAIFRNSG